MDLKKTIFHKSVRPIIRSFSNEIKKDIGKYILDLQKGKIILFPASRPMPSVGKGVSELRIRDQDGIYRVFYTVKLGNAVIIFHAFQKKDQKTPKKEIDLAKVRLNETMETFGGTS